MVVRQFETQAECENEKFRNSEWGPERSGSMLETIRDFKTPFGTMGDLLDQTPRDKISRVYLEDKLFETWTHGRTVLIGDGNNI
jgi:2-polyprenyl-6-methoxyphenol hydroxylase-like FAD-dependent oxidoreductase